MTRSIRKTDKTSNAKRTGQSKSKSKTKSATTSQKKRSKIKAVKKTTSTNQSATTKNQGKAVKPAKKSAASSSSKGVAKKKSTTSQEKSKTNSRLSATKGISPTSTSKKSTKSLAPMGAQKKPTSTSPARKSAPKNGQLSSSKTSIPVGNKTLKTGKPVKQEDDFNLTVSIGNTKGNGPRRILRAKSFPELPTSQSYGHAHGTPEIPSRYGIDKLVVMPQDPERLFTYWELTPNRLEQGALKRRPHLQYQEALKLTWEPSGLFEANYVFLPVEFHARKCYLAVPGEGPRNYRLELGWLDDEGHFILLLESEPTESIENWSFTRSRLSNEKGVTAYTARQTITLGASEVAVLGESHGLMDLENLSSSLFSSSSLALARKEEPSRSTSIAAKSYAKIEIAGTLRPGSQVRIGDETFLPNGKGRFQAAIQADGDTLHLEVITPEGNARFFAYDLSTPSP